MDGHSSSTALNKTVGLFLLLTVSGCSDLPPIEYKTEYIDIGVDSDDPVCEGSLRALDDQVAWVEEQLEFEVDHRLTVYLFADGPGEFCDFDDPGGGCYNPRREHVYSTLGAARHEVIHAAVDQLGVPTPFFSEGIALALQGGMIGFFWSTPSSNLGLDTNDLSYGTAGHFGRWMLERYPPDQIREIHDKSSTTRGRSHAESAFEKVFGESFAEVEEEYFASSPEYYRTIDITPKPAVGDGPGDGPGDWRVSLEFDCGSEDTRGIEAGGMWREAVFQIASAGWYVLEVGEPGRAKVEIRRLEDIEVGDALPPDVVPPVGEEWNDTAEWINAATPTALFLEAETYLITVRVKGADPVVVDLSLHPKWGSVPAKP